jgi:hypothetical protein
MRRVRGHVRHLPSLVSALRIVVKRLTLLAVRVSAVVNGISTEAGGFSSLVEPARVFLGPLVQSRGWLSAKKESRPFVGI